MKKFLALAALVLGLASCQTEPEGLGVVTGGEVDTVVTVSLPAATRSSEQSGLENIDLGTYDIRYIFEVYDAEDDAFVTRQEQKCDDTTVSFPVRLIPSRDYYFVVWADFVNGDKACYNVESLKNVSIIESTWTAMNEARDAYTGVIMVEDYNGSKQIDDIILTRPFGKLRVVTTDMNALKSLNNSGLKSVDVTYTTQVGTAFNALYPAVTAPEGNKVFTYELTNAGVYGETGNNLTLFADYIFVQGTATINFNMVVTYQDNKTSEVTFNTDIPVVRNQLTTVIGSILTDANDVKVEVNEDFVAKNTILDVFERGGEYTLTENIELPANNLIVKKDVVLNLGGYTINAGKEDSAEMTGTDIAAITVVDGAKLTIEGAGTIRTEYGEYGVYVKKGDVVIKGGNFVAGTSAVQVYNGTATIEGGKFEATKSDVYVVNCIDANWKNGTAQVEIKGGEFKNFNPANNAAEGIGTCFVAEGYISVPAAEYFKVVPFKGNFTLESNVEASKLVVTENVTLNLNGKTLKGGQAYDASKGMTGVDISAITVVNGATLTIEGEGTIEGAVYGVYAKEGKLIINGGNFVAGTSAVQVSNAEVNIYGGTFSNTGSDKRYTINCLDADWKNGNAKVEIKGGSFKEFNPANNAAEGVGTNFVAEGYGVFENGEWFEVHYTGGESTIAAIVNNAADLNTKMAEGGVIILAEGDFGNIVAKSNVTLVGTPEATVYSVALNDASNFTVRNITFDAANAVYSASPRNTTAGFANIVSGNESYKTGTATGGNIVIDGCTFTGTFANGGEAIAFTDQGRTHHGKVTIKNCTFEQTGAYYHIYGYYAGMNNLVVENNVFATAVDYRANTISLFSYKTNAPVVVKDNVFMADSDMDSALFYTDPSNNGFTLDASGNTFAE